MTCIYGQLEVFGHIIKQGQPAQDVFSAYTHSCLSIKGMLYPEPEKSEKEVRKEIRALLKPHMKLGNCTLSIKVLRFPLFYMKRVGSRLGLCCLHPDIKKSPLLHKPVVEITTLGI